VEDDEDLARVILTSFEHAGIVVYHAPRLRQAIELCESARPDLIILDLALPDGDGLELVDWLRTQKEFRRLPLVVYSAREVPSSERQLFQLGPTEFLTKTKVQPQDVEVWFSPCFAATSLDLPTRMRLSKSGFSSSFRAILSAESERRGFFHATAHPDH